MIEPISEPATDRSSTSPLEVEVFSTSDRTLQVDRCFHVLADRRRRLCLYYLHCEHAPLTIRDLALVVELSMAPPGASITEDLIDEATDRLNDTHLPKLQDVGLIQVRDGHVKLTPNPAFPVRELLSLIAKIELEG